jgi:hypothetical protein
VDVMIIALSFHFYPHPLSYFCPSSSNT